MNFVDFHIPARVIPTRAFHLPEHSLHIFPSAVSCTLVQQCSRPSLGVLLYGKGERLTAEYVGRVLADIVTLTGSILPENEAHAWLNAQWLNIHRVAYTLKEGAEEDYLQYLAEIVLPEIQPRSGVQIACDFGDMALPMFPPPRPRLDFIQALNTFLSLPEDDELKSKIKLFYVASCSFLIIGRVYRNQNLQLSLLLTILESMLPTGKTMNSTTCSNCGHVIAESRMMSTTERVDAYVDGLGWGGPDADIFKKMLNQLFRQARNPFYHAGKVANIQDVSNKLIAKLGRNHITLADEVEEGEPRISGAMELENHLRLSLFAKLDTISGNRGEEAT